MPPRKPYSSDVSDEEWGFVAPELALVRAAAAPRHHDLREVFTARRWMGRAGAPWRGLPRDCPPWAAVYHPPQRWLAAGVFEALAHDLRALLRRGAQRGPSPGAVVVDSRPLQATPASGARAGDDGHKRREGSKRHLAVDPLGHLLALTVTPAAVPDRAQGAALAAQVQAVTGGTVELAYVDQGYTGTGPALDAAEHGIYLAVLKLPEAKRGFVLLPRRWVIERSVAWATRFRRLAQDDERLPQTVAGLHFVAFAYLMLPQAITMFAGP